MNLLVFSVLILSLWIILSNKFYKYLKGISNEEKNIKKCLFISQSFGFIFLFIFIGLINIIFHSFGSTLVYGNLLIPITFLIIYKNRVDIKEFLYQIISEISYQYKNLFKDLDPIKIILLFVICTQILCLFIRLLLPITHGDALTQYFYDSLQISRLNNLSILNFYQIGEFFRTDSLASFFDALIIQFTDNWLLVKLTRALALILIILNSIEMAINIGSLSFKKGFLLTAIILTIPDVWDIALSGKQDVYVFLFELAGFYSICLSIISKSAKSKINYSLISIFISLMSVNLRLSSLTFLFISISLFIYYICIFKTSLYLSETIRFILSIPRSIQFLIIISILTSLIIPILNFKYFNNPLFWLSPPGPLKIIFPNAISRLNYETTKDLLELRNLPSLIKPIGTILYSSLAAEPIRFGLNKFKESSQLFYKLSEYMNYIGPKGMMVSILSFSPFTLLPYFGLKNIKYNNKKLILFLLTAWIFLWSLSIPYTRVALASSTCILIFVISEPFKIKNILNNFNFLKLLRILLVSYGFFCIFIFSIWSASYISDLPIKSLISNKSYSRTHLSREYLKLQNKILNKKDIVPSIEFESSWKKIEDTNNNKYLFLKNTPSLFGYFINKGLIIYNSKFIPEEISKKSICFELDPTQKIKKIQC